MIKLAELQRKAILLGKIKKLFAEASRIRSSKSLEKADKLAWKGADILGLKPQASRILDHANSSPILKAISKAPAPVRAGFAMAPFSTEITLAADALVRPVHTIKQGYGLVVKDSAKTLETHASRISKALKKVKETQERPPLLHIKSGM